MSAVDQEAQGAELTLGQLVASATAEMSALVHDEIALAKVEIKQDVRRAGIGSGAAIAAGVFVLASVPMLSFALAYWIHTSGLGLAWCFLIVAGVFWLLAGVVGLLAYVKFKKVKPPVKTIEAVKQTAALVGTVKPHPRPVSDKAVGVARSSS
ncbi:MULTISPECIES: phage holin family protein [unclassified Streptomyces]|uniref:phage holin family protein n=1 Tax=unclassified Streptomyces TaxID=2593676 RepID=UPI002E2A6A1D|nr:phage holin family protein [Streptomyces sp. NBC_01439]